MLKYSLQCLWKSVSSFFNLEPCWKLLKEHNLIWYFCQGATVDLRGFTRTHRCPTSSISWKVGLDQLLSAKRVVLYHQYLEEIWLDYLLKVVCCPKTAEYDQVFFKQVQNCSCIFMCYCLCCCCISVILKFLPSLFGLASHLRYFLVQKAHTFHKLLYRNFHCQWLFNTLSTAHSYLRNEIFDFGSVRHNISRGNILFNWDKLRNYILKASPKHRLKTSYSFIFCGRSIIKYQIM